jgi:hypothetical protein
MLRGEWGNCRNRVRGLLGDVLTHEEDQLIIPHVGKLPISNREGKKLR